MCGVKRESLEYKADKKGGSILLLFLFFFLHIFNKIVRVSPAFQKEPATYSNAGWEILLDQLELISIQVLLSLIKKGFDVNLEDIPMGWSYLNVWTN